MKTFTITIYADAGHAWGKVKRRVLHSLGIANSISAYSYQHNDNVFLEEDVDLGILITALHDTGHSVVFKEKTATGLSRIRSYERYAVAQGEQLSLELA
jgi:hypothetical protein